MTTETDDGDLTLLVEEQEPVALGGLRALLDAHEIAYVIQGEHHSQLVGGLFGFNPALSPRVLVARRDLERARALLEADAQPETVAQGGPPLTGAVCPVHELPAIATCGRCGTFLCSGCNALGDAPLCEDCTKLEDSDRKPAADRVRVARKVVAGAMLVPFLIGAVLLVLAVLFRLFR